MPLSDLLSRHSSAPPSLPPHRIASRISILTSPFTLPSPRALALGLLLCKFYPRSEETCSGSATSSLFRSTIHTYLGMYSTWQRCSPHNVRGQVAKSTKTQNNLTFSVESTPWKESRYFCSLRHSSALFCLNYYRFLSI